MRKNLSTTLSAAVVGLGLLLAGCGVSEDAPAPKVNHDLSGKDFIRVNDIYMIGSTNSDSATSGSARVVGSVGSALVVADEDARPAEYRLRVPIVDDSGVALPHLDGTADYNIDMEVRPGVIGSPTAYIPFTFSLSLAPENVSTR